MNDRKVALVTEERRISRSQKAPTFRLQNQENLGGKIGIQVKKVARCSVDQCRT